jgi:predicted Fe-Mo cluster-binding NifX family protein
MARGWPDGNEMARKFVFIKDVETLLRQGKTEIQLPEGSRFSPAAWDLIRENNIAVSFTSQPLAPDDADGERIQNRNTRKQPSHNKDISEPPQLVAIASPTREVSGTVGKNAVSSPFYLIFDHDGKFIDIIKNPFFDGGTNADQMIVNFLAASQVSAIAAENFSDALKGRLGEKNIQYFEISGSIEEAVEFVFNKKGGDKSVSDHK